MPAADDADRTADSSLIRPRPIQARFRGAVRQVRKRDGAVADGHRGQRSCLRQVPRVRHAAANAPCHRMGAAFGKVLSQERPPVLVSAETAPAPS